MRLHTLSRICVALMLAMLLATSVAFAKDQDTCPVMGGKLTSKEYYADHAGKRVYFCCPGCDGQFLEDPEKYIKMLEDQGVELEKVPAE